MAISWVSHRVLLAVQVVVLVGFATLLYVSGGRQLIPVPATARVPIHDVNIVMTQESKGKVLSDTNVTAYKDSIIPPPPVPKLECPTLDADRYKTLQPAISQTEIVYFFAINLRENIAILPRLLGSVVEVVRFLGPKNCAVSVIEGNSVDGTNEVLDAIAPGLLELGALYNFTRSEINPKKGDRIEALAALRNLALEPLFEEKRAGPDTTVIFLNDVAACPEDILELVLQRKVQEADMVCGMDWTYAGENPTFYDVWIARTLSGHQFFENPEGSWDYAWNLFSKPEDTETKDRYNAKKPFQVFSCWNGLAVFGATPLFLAGDSKPSSSSSTNTTAATIEEAGQGVRFRASHKGECFMGEPTLFCKDLWWRGYRKIAVVPTVHLEYSDEKARKIKDLKGYTSKLVEGEDQVYRIQWQEKPPERVWCSPSWTNQSWVPWNETLV